MKNNEHLYFKPAVRATMLKFLKTWKNESQEPGDISSTKKTTADTPSPARGGHFRIHLCHHLRQGFQVCFFQMDNLVTCWLQIWHVLAIGIFSKGSTPCGCIGTVTECDDVVYWVGRGRLESLLIGYGGGWGPLP